MISASRVQRRASSYITNCPVADLLKQRNVHSTPHFLTFAPEDGFSTVVQIREKHSTESEFESLTNQQNPALPLHLHQELFETESNHVSHIAHLQATPKRKQKSQHFYQLSHQLLFFREKARYTIHAQLHVQNPKLRRSRNVLLRNTT